MTSSKIGLVLWIWMAVLVVPSARADVQHLSPAEREAKLAFLLQHFGVAFGYSSNVVHRGDTTLALPRAEHPLDVHYQWNGVHSLDELLTRTATTGFLVLKDGKIVTERYFGGASEKSLFMSESVAKSFTSTLVGLAIADGKIAGVDRPIVDYLPELKGSGFENDSIRNLLEMSSGVNFTEEYANGTSDINVLWKSTIAGTRSFSDFVRSVRSSQPPGRAFAYQSIDTQVLGWLVTRVTGETLSEYLSGKIWQPAGMEADATWVTDHTKPQGMEAAYCCLSATLRDYARFGLLFMNKGQLNGKQIVPAAWVAEATAPQSEAGPQGPGPVLRYGYQWWITPGADHAFTALGLYQQFIYVNPGEGVVIVKTSAFEPSNASKETLTAFEAICQALKDS